jgi:hypothetical protein
MKRILSLDGGGIHGVFTLQILRRIEAELASRHRGPAPFVLADYFDLIAGTSTGAIIAAMLSWGASVDAIERFYLEQAATIFYPSSYFRRWWYHRFTSEGIARFLQRYFAEEDGTPSLLGTARLRTLLLIVLRNATTGSPWPVTNNPKSLYNDRPPGQTNLEIPLWKLVRASTAAPTYFPPERITVCSRLGVRKPFEFIDGGISPYNNPAYLAYLTATLPEYRLNFPRGIGELLVVSVGVGRRELCFRDGEMHDMNVVGHVQAIIRAMLDAASVQQDLLCRTTGLCLHGDELDRELGRLESPAAPAASPGRQFSYVRYNHTYTDDEISRALSAVGGKWDLANLKLMPAVIEAGRAAAAQVKATHFA